MIICSLDLETLSTKSTAAIVQIGAIFGPHDQPGKYEFGWEAEIDRSDAEFYGTTDFKTLEWWQTQPEETRKRVFGGTVALRDVLKEFARLYALSGAEEIWSHATFDVPVLGNAYDEVGLARPWHYRAPRDIRTLTTLAGEAGFPWIKQEDRNIHTALADAKYQLEYIQDLRVKLTTKQ